ncbi:MAG: ParB/RepB/Spo0J family partition protein [Patescibacteria group bacterium]
MDEQSIQNLDINLLNPNPLQPRGLITPESLVDLVDSIREHGILEPLVVAETPSGYQIIAGERRWRASKIAGLTNVPCLVRKATHRGMLEMAIVENIQRVDLNPLERAQGFKKLMDDFGLGTAEIAQRVGKSQPYVSNSLRLLTLPDALKDAMISGIVTEGHIRALAAIEDPNLMVEALRQILKEEGSVRRAEEVAREYKSKAQQTPVSGNRIYSQEWDQFQKEIGKLVTGKAKFTQTNRGGMIVLRIPGSMDKTSEIMRKIGGAIKEILARDLSQSGQTENT